MPFTNTQQKAVLVIVVGALLACAVLVLSPERPPRPEPGRRAPVVKTKMPSRPVLVLLKSREHIVAVHADEIELGGPRMSVYTLDGTPLANEITGREMQQQFPMLYEFYRSSYAEAWAGG
jgi:hypothetical protein